MATIIYTYTDEAPAAGDASRCCRSSEAYAATADVELETARHLPGRADLAHFLSGLRPSSGSPTRSPSSASWPRRPRPTSSSCPTSAPRCRSSRPRSPSCRSQGYDIPDYPEAPRHRPRSKEIRARYDTGQGQRGQPGAARGQPDRRAPASVKAFARKHPHSMGAWSPDSKTHVATMDERRLPLQRERSVTVAKPTDVRPSSTSAPTARSRSSEGLTALLAGEVIDAAAACADAALQALPRASRSPTPRPRACSSPCTSRPP